MVRGKLSPQYGVLDMTEGGSRTDQTEVGLDGSRQTGARELHPINGKCVTDRQRNADTGKPCKTQQAM